MLFDGLTNFVSDPSPSLPQPTVQPSAPPTRFGAIRITLPPDPAKSVISIFERPNDTNTHDYVVYITQYLRAEGTYYAELLTLLNTAPPSARIEIYIGSPGGSLHTGAMIASAIQTSKATVTTVSMGVVASASALIWSYGHNRIAAPGSVLMFHMSSHGDWDNSKAIAIRAENTVRYVKEVAIDPLVEQGVLTAEEAETIVDRRRDLWLDAETVNARLEAVRAKIV